MLIIVVALAALGTATAVLTAFKVTNPWAIGAAAVGVPVVTVLSGFVQDRYKKVAARREESVLKLQDGCLVLPNGRLPKVSEINDPIRLGVHPAIVLTPATDKQQPVYVPRDIDVQLREHLTASGFVLLVGDSTAGKSRTAFEAMRAALPQHLLIAPHDRTALPAAIEQAARARRAVLWLSDLEHYLGTGGLTREHVARLTSGKGQRVILATLRSAEQARLTSQLADSDQAARSAGREVQETLEQAHTIRLARRFSSGELERTQDLISDARIAFAVQQAGEYGIAEYLASGPELQRDFDNAWDVGVNPRGAALVAAAIDCRRAGFTTPAPRRLIEELHTTYLNAKGGHRLRPESMEEAWAWATRPRRATTALLSPVQAGDSDLVVVFDYLVDLLQLSEGPLAHVDERVILAALNHVQLAEDADQIASIVDRQGRYHLAELAWGASTTLRRETLGDEHADTLASRNNLARVFKELGRLQEAEAEHRAVLEVSRRLLGDEHSTTLATRGSWANVLRQLGRLQDAEAEHRAVLEVSRRLLSDEHFNTLATRNNLANVLRQLGRFKEAEAEHRAVLEIRHRLLGAEHRDTLSSMNNLGLSLEELGRFEEAEAVHGTALEMRRKVLGDKHPDTLSSLNNLVNVLWSLGRLENPEADYAALCELFRQELGEEHPHTLTTWGNFAGVLGELGKLQEAEAECRALLEVRSRVLGEEHPHTLGTRRNLAHVLRKLGRLQEAEAEHLEALKVFRRVLGEEHPHTLKSKQDLAAVSEELDRLREGPGHAS
ncbi:tetratricopeptide repeat protein [Sphaerisporangium perillae]|uniref:tetratricopeptide repeat protein n=1 Tax=Sphaerisporangium perillae TaxID=2935860 RepID=UPI00200D7FEC|nr:tetratricopeptide repeat protein [Sphaerisporangium perillae]